MMGSARYDWRKVQIPTPFAWSKEGVWVDCNGDAFEVGSTVRLVRDAVAFDEKGNAVGIWDVGRIIRVTAASKELNVVIFEGVVGVGWASGVLPADNVELVNKAESVDA